MMYYSIEEVLIMIIFYVILWKTYYDVLFNGRSITICYVYNTSYYCFNKSESKFQSPRKLTTIKLN